MDHRQETERKLMSQLMYNRPPEGYELDYDQGRFRIGLLVLENDYVIERDMMAMRPQDDEVMLFVSRVPFAETCDPKSLAAMASRLAAATDTILPGGRLDAVIYGCTSGTATIGYENVAEKVRSVRPDALCITPITAAHAAFRKLGLTRIAVFTPYTDEVTQTTVQALEQGGAHVVKVSNFNIAKTRDISAVTSQSIVAGAVAADDPQADGLFISCTDFRAAQVVEEIEERIGKPVVTSNQPSFWQAVRGAGYAKPIEGYGKVADNLNGPWLARQARQW